MTEQMKIINWVLRIFLLLILFTPVPKSYSQIPVSPGYVILKNNDTIFGNVENAVFGSLNRFIIIKNGTSSIQILKPTQVRKFFVSPDNYFQTKQINGKQKFLQLISEGRINLYRGNKGLYISCKSDSLVLIGGAKEYETKNGKTYLVVNNSFKTSLKGCISDTNYYHRIVKMSSDKNAVTKLIKEINGQDIAIPGRPANNRFHTNQYSLDFGYIVNKLNIQDLRYKNDTLWANYGDVSEQKLNAWQLGFSYKRNLNSTNLYLYGGLKFSKMQKTSFERLGLLYKTTSSNGSSFMEDTVGFVKDRYQYDMSMVSIPFGLYEEITNNRLRLFYSVGFSGTFF